jgi:hypothetical protein
MIHIVGRVLMAVVCGALVLTLLGMAVALVLAAAHP